LTIGVIPMWYTANVTEHIEHSVMTVYYCSSMAVVRMYANILCA